MSSKNKGAGYNTYKVIAALRMASREEGVSLREMAERMKINAAAAGNTFKALVLAGEVVEDKGRFYSDVYAKEGDKLLVWRKQEEETSVPPTYKEEVTQIVLDAQIAIAGQYPVSMFGDVGKFINGLTNAICMRIIKGLSEIT